MLKRRWPWVFLALLVIAGLAIYLFPRSRPVEAIEATRGALSQSVVATGRVDSPSRIGISSQLAARIERIAVREGDSVAAGDVLVEFARISVAYQMKK